MMLYLAEAGIKDIDLVASVLEAQGISSESDFGGIDDMLRTELDYALKQGGVTIGDRAKLHKVVKGQAVNTPNVAPGSGLAQSSRTNSQDQLSVVVPG